MEGSMERRIAIVLAVILVSWAALYAIDIKLFGNALSAALLHVVSIS
jgi:hypothetical protein